MKEKTTAALRLRLSYKGSRGTLNFDGISPYIKYFRVFQFKPCHFVVVIVDDVLFVVVFIQQCTDCLDPIKYPVISFLLSNTSHEELKQ